MIRERQNAEHYESINGSPATYLHQHLDEAVEIMQRLDHSMSQLVGLAHKDYTNAMVVDGEKQAQYADNVATSTAAYDQTLSNLFNIMNWEVRRAQSKAQSQLERVPENLPAHGMYQRWMQRLHELLDGIRGQIEADTEIVRRLARGRQAARRMEMELAKDPAVTFHDRIGFHRREIVDLTISSPSSSPSAEDGAADGAQPDIKREAGVGQAEGEVGSCSGTLQDDNLSITPATLGRSWFSEGRSCSSQDQAWDAKSDSSSEEKSGNDKGAKSGRQRKSMGKSTLKRSAQQGTGTSPPRKIIKTKHAQSSSRALKARKDGYLALEDASSDEKPYDSDQDIDQYLAPRLERSTVDSTLRASIESFDRGLEHYCSEVSPGPAADNFLGAISELLHSYGTMIRTLMRQVHELRYPSGPRTPAELDQIRDRLQQRINVAVLPAPTPTSTRLCNGRMSDGSKCQLPWDACFLRHERVHHDDPARTRCYGQSAKVGKHGQCANNWLHCRVHNAKYLAKYHAIHGMKPNDDRGLVRNRSTLLRSIEKRYGNQTWSVRHPQTGQYIDLDGPQLPAAFTQRRRRERLARLRKYTALNVDPDFDSQGPEGPPDNHPGPSGSGQGPPPSGSSADVV
ncbi:hypothetical protein AC1031_010256 [Aphanomyces cochlioides]|nr:hypothetical protein AC1031_010256 [Aphanomyces cochlioides]